MVPLDDVDRRLLNALQRDFPLTREPFSTLGRELGVDASEVVRRIEILKREGILRYIGPIFDARKLGYRGTLAAMQLPTNWLEEAARVVNEHPGVSHNYARDHKFNLWFTLTLPHHVDPQSEIEALGHRAGAEAVLNLPPLRVFKLRTYFDAVGDGDGEPAGNGCCETSGPAEELSADDRAVINEVQRDLPLVDRPFDQMARCAGVEVELFLDICQSLRRRGIMRRFCGMVRHDWLGFKANALACWAATGQVVLAAGGMLASLPEVSHCYERRASRLWPYNLFAMIHGHHPQICHDVVAKVSRDLGLADHQLLFTVKEFKKVRGRYLV